MKIALPLLALVLVSSSCIVSVKEGDEVIPPADGKRGTSTSYGPTSA